MTWFAIKSPDGEWVLAVPGSRKDAIIALVSHLRLRLFIETDLEAEYFLSQQSEPGYRCVEVQLVEVTAPTGGAESKEEGK